jgi:hypothetical protein
MPDRQNQHAGNQFRLEGTETSSVPLEKRHPPVWWAVRRFQLNIDALREMLHRAAPEMRELDKLRLGANALAAVNALPKENQEQLEALLEEEQRERPPEAPEEEPQRGDTTGEDLSEADGKRLHEIFRGDRFALASFLEGYMAAVAGPSREAIVQNSFLIMAVSAFEVLVSGLAARHFVAFPGALDPAKEEFSLEDVEGFRTTEDAIDLLLSRRVGDLMRGGLDDWAKWFLGRGKIKLSELAIDWESAREIFQRRHLVTHSGGLVSSAYLAKVKIPDPPALGSRAMVDEDYLEAAFDHLDALGTGMGIQAWGIWYPDQLDDSAAALLRRTYQTTLLRRWQVTEKLATMEVRCADELRHSIRCNGWLSLAERTGYETIRAEVEQWDVSALDGRFKLARLVLLQELDAALALVPALLASEQLRPGELREWPILRTLRAHPEYEALAMAHKV